MTQKHPASSVKEIISAKKCKVLDCPSQSPDWNPIEHEFHQLKRRVRAATPQNKHKLELAALKAGESILISAFYICLMFNCPNIYAHINEWDEL